MEQLSIKTHSNFEMIDITGEVRSVIRKKGIRSGLCYVFALHTTAAVTINENADPDVPRDILTGLDRMVPLHGDYRHMEGNSAAHIKSSLVGSSETVFIENGDLVLGTWQSIFFCEFDGPRTRRVVVKLLESSV
jgi:secondary thiamine-phosphate synthase enzyme